MATYVIGDIQGCYQALQALLQKIVFDPAQDYLWLTGDLVNRGSDSLAVLRWVKMQGDRVICVLGNHDLHLLAVATKAVPLTTNDNFYDVLSAPDLPELIDWLRSLPLLHYDAQLQALLVHAGIAPEWDLTEALSCAQEITQLLRGPDYFKLLIHLYGHSSRQWSPTLYGWDRIKVIINYFTRMRFLDADSRLQFYCKGDIEAAPIGHMPWFALPRKLSSTVKIFFGHWSALQGKAVAANIFPLDTGCCWGRCLTALRIEDHTYFSVDCKPYV